MMEPGVLYWAVAWTMMAVAFLAAAGSILIGARNLDRQQSGKTPQFSELINKK